MSAMGNLLVEEGERLLAARELNYTEEAWDAIMDELMSPKRLTPVQAATYVVNLPNGDKRSRLTRGHYSRHVEREQGGYIVTDHTAEVAA